MPFPSLLIHLNNPTDRQTQTYNARTDMALHNALLESKIAKTQLKAANEAKMQTAMGAFLPLNCKKPIKILP